MKNIITSGYGEILEVDGIKRYKNFTCNKKTALLMVRSQFKKHTDDMEEITERAIIVKNGDIINNIALHVRAELPEGVEPEFNRYNKFFIEDRLKYVGKKGKKHYFSVGDWYIETVVN